MTCVLSFLDVISDTSWLKARKHKVFAQIITASQLSQLFTWQYNIHSTVNMFFFLSSSSSPPPPPPSSSCYFSKCLLFNFNYISPRPRRALFYGH
jgi:hypothetical protein